MFFISKSTRVPDSDLKWPWPKGKTRSDMNHCVSVGFNCLDGKYDVALHCKIIHESKWLAEFDTKEEAIEFTDKEIKRLNIDPNWKDGL